MDEQDELAIFGGKRDVDDLGDKKSWDDLGD